MIAIVAGGSGLTGQALVSELIRSDEIKEVRTLLRASPPWKPHSKVKEYPLPWDGFKSLSKHPESHLSGDLYFCALGTTMKKAGTTEAFRAVDYDAVFEFAKLCEQRNGRCFALVSSSGAHPNSPIFYSRVKGEIEQEILKLKIPRILIFRPGLLIGERQESRPTERAAIQAWRALAAILPESISHAAGTPVSKLARVITQESLKTDAGHLTFEPKDFILDQPDP